jgi:hypothetical protein
MQQLSKVFTRRILADGIERVVGGNAVDTVLFKSDNKYRHYMSTWETFGTPGEALVEPIMYETDTFPTGIVVFPPGKKLNLPKPYGSNSFTEDTNVAEFGGKVWMSYATNRDQHFSAHLVSGPTPTGPWTLQGSTPEGGVNDILEATKIIRLGTTWYVLAVYKASDNSGPVGATELRVYDLTMALLVRRQFPVGSPSSPSHFAPFALQRNGITTYGALGFNATRYENRPVSWGDVVLIFATETNTGYDFEFPLLPA